MLSQPSAPPDVATGPPRPLPAAARLFPNVYYGWVVAVGSAVVAAVGTGVGFYGQGILLAALAEQRGFDETAIAGASTLYFLVSALVGTVIGRFVDRHGAPLFIVAGSLLLGTGLVLTGRAERPGELFWIYPLMATGFAMAGGIPGSALIARWFVALRARALTISQTGVSVGGVVLVPVATWIIASQGIELGTTLMAALVVGVSLPTVALVLRGDPGAHGLDPDGGLAPPSDNPLLAREHQLRVFRAREVLRSPAFWQLALGFGAILFVQMGVLIQQLRFTSGRVGTERAALLVASTPLASIVGRFVVGAIADRANKRRVLLALTGIQALSLAAFSLADGAVGLLVASLLFGLTIGSIFMLQSLLVGELFGMASFGLVSGMLALVTQTLGALGPYALNLWAAHVGSFELALGALSGVVAVSGLVLGLRQPPRALVGLLVLAAIGLGCSTPHGGFVFSDPAPRASSLERTLWIAPVEVRDAEGPTADVRDVALTYNVARLVRELQLFERVRVEPGTIEPGDWVARIEIVRMLERETPSIVSILGAPAGIRGHLRADYEARLELTDARGKEVARADRTRQAELPSGRRYASRAVTFFPDQRRRLVEELFLAALDLEEEQDP